MQANKTVRGQGCNLVTAPRKLKNISTYPLKLFKTNFFNYPQNMHSKTNPK